MKPILSCTAAMLTILNKINWRRSACALLLMCATTTITLRAQTFQVLHSFDSTDGAFSYAPLIQATDGNLYGTTLYGGAGGDGTVFTITPSGAFTSLYSFCSVLDCTDGQWPNSGLVQASDGNLYGTTVGGGAIGYGSIFKITPGGELTTIFSSCAQFGCPSGLNPRAGLVQGADGSLYGITFGGGNTYGGGTIFKITLGGVLTVLHDFCPGGNCSDGWYPYGTLVQGADGNFYGTTQGGGNSRVGTIFKITPGGTFTTLYSFCSQPGCADGELPYAGLVLASDGNFYGTTTQGGAGYDFGTVFKFTPGGTLTTLYSFGTAGNGGGANPQGTLIQATDGNFYGTTYQGGARGYGTIFEITPTGTLTTLHSFCSETNCVDGTGPVGGLVQATNGTFYGTTFLGGTGPCSYYENPGCGVVYSLSLFTQVSLSPLSLSFGPQDVGATSAPQTVTVTNTGNAALYVSSIAASGDFAETDTCTGGPAPAIVGSGPHPAPVPPGGNCTISVTFTPSAILTRTGAITITDNGTNSPQTIALSGPGVLPVVCLPGSLIFGSTVEFTTGPTQTVICTNTQNTNVTFSIISTNLADFGVTNSGTCSTLSPLAPLAHCTIVVSFAPSIVGVEGGTLTIIDSANSQSVTLSGRGNPPSAAPPPS